MQELQSPALTQLTVASGVPTLLDEWLGLWFDGGTHQLGAEPACLWPAVTRRFGQSQVAAQPLNSVVEMRMVISPRAEARAVVDTALYQGRLITDYVMFNFWIRAKTPGQAQLAAQTVAQLLHGLLTHPSTRAALAEKGIAHLQPQGPASVMPSVDYAERLLICAAQLQYPVIQTDPAADLPTPR